MEIYQLTNETIDILSDRIGEMYLSLGCTKKETMRAKLLLEEALLKYQSRYGEETELYFRVYRVLSQTRFVVRLRAGSFDPFTLEENPMGFMIQSVLSTFEGNMPTWKYRNLENELVFTVRKKAKLNAALKIAITVAVSVIAGILCRAFLPAEGLSTFVRDYFVPLSDAYAGLFCVMATLLTFFSITLSIVHIGDMAVVGAIGGKIMRRFYLMTAIIIVATTLLILPFYPIGGGSGGGFDVKSIYDIIIGFIPNNIVVPFSEFNSIHIMIIGAMFGFALLYMGQKGENLVKVFDECNLVSVYVNDFLNKFICFYVAVKVFELITTSDFSKLALAGQMALFIIIGELVIFVFYSVYVCVTNKLPPAKYLRALTPPFVVCLSSANFGAAYNTCCDALEELDSLNDESNMAFSLGGVVFRPACTLVFVFSALAMASSYNVEISAVWVLKTVILSILLVAAVPNIPGVSVSVITVLFKLLGLPNEAIGLMIAVNAPLQFLTVAVDTWCLLGESVCITTWRKKQLAKGKK